VIRRLVLERLESALGCGKIYGPYGGSVYQYRADGQVCIDVIKMLWPYLSSPKQQQVIEGYTRWRDTRASKGLPALYGL